MMPCIKGKSHPMKLYLVEMSSFGLYSRNIEKMNTPNAITVIYEMDRLYTSSK